MHFGAGEIERMGNRRFGCSINAAEFGLDGMQQRQQPVLPAACRGLSGNQVVYR